MLLLCFGPSSLCCFSGNLTPPLGRKSLCPHFRSLFPTLLAAFAALLVMAVAGVTAAILFLLRFLRSNDEHERQINYRALTFAFTGTLTFSAAVGFLQSFGFHPGPWLGIPALMIILWSIGLILYSWRYR
jgi:hypothetical protein